MTHYPALGFDPAPGLCSKTQGVADALSSTLETLEQITSTLTALGQPGAAWQGKAARAFSERLGDLPPQVTAAAASHREAHRAMQAWADCLESLQRTARSLEMQAEAAQAVVVRAQRSVDWARAASYDPLDPAQVEAARRAVVAAEAAFGSAQASLAEVRAQAKVLRSEHEAAVTDVARSVRAAAQYAPVEPGVFEKLGAAVDDVVESLKAMPAKVWDYVKEHAHVIAEVADVFSEMATVLGIVALFLPPPANLIVAGVAVGSGLLALGGHGLADAAGVSIPCTTYIFDALSVVAGGAGLIGGLGVQGSRIALAEHQAAGRGGGVVAAREAEAYYRSIDNGALVAGGVNDVANVATGQLTESGEDRPFMHWVPDSPGEALALGALGPAGLAFVSAVQHGAEKDRAAAVQRDRDEWLQ